jgi:hypothetical protein
MDASPDLALLIAAPQPGETAMYRDVSAMAQALLARGFSADRILSLHGRLDRRLVTAFLQATSRLAAALLPTPPARAGGRRSARAAQIACADIYCMLK